MPELCERDQRMYDAAENAFTSEGGYVAPAAQDSQPAALAPVTLAVPRETELTAQDARQRVCQRIMEEASVTYDGRNYCYDGHPHAGLLDAIKYSTLMRADSGDRD
jgi:hypothetical protein